MLYYLPITEIDNIPETMIAVSILPSDYKIEKTVTVDMINLSTTIDNLDYDKLSEDNYKKYIKKNHKASIVSLMYWLNKGMNLVLVYDEVVCGELEFNYAKALCEAMKERYGCNYDSLGHVGFVSVLDIKRDNNITEEHYYKYIKDLKHLNKNFLK